MATLFETSKAMAAFPDVSLRCETDRFGPFRFQIGLDSGELALPLVRAEDAYRSFGASPLAQVANLLEREVLVQSVHGTNTIEGAELSLQQTAEALDLSPEQVRAEQQVRVRNIKAAYDIAHKAALRPGWVLDVPFMQAVHAEICRDIADADNLPGRIRDNSKSKVTYVGDALHGGRYKPPQYGRDIERLMAALVQWHQMLCDAQVPALIRAPLIHLYFERIHPFWDGNGRVGRVIEATLLQQAGFRYAPFALSRYYLDRVDDYFSEFNLCRKADEAGRDYPNQGFVRLHLEGMRRVIERLHGKVNDMVRGLLFEASLAHMLHHGEINARQNAVARAVYERGRLQTYEEIRREHWYQSLYAKLTDKTRQRDLRALYQLGVLRLDVDGKLRAGFVPPP